MNDKNKLSSRFEKKPLQKTVKFNIAKKPDSVDFDSLKDAFYQKINSVPVWFEYSPDEQRDLIKRFVSAKTDEVDIVCEKLFLETQGFGAVNNLISQENVSAVFVNGTKSVYIEIEGKILNTEMKLSSKELLFLENLISHKCSINKNVVSFKSGDFQLSLIKSPIASDGINIIIRKMNFLSAQDFIDSGRMDEEIYEFILSLLNNRKNIVISADVNAGKTVFLDMLLDAFIKNKRSILIENAPILSVESDTLTKFVVNKGCESYSDFLSEVIKCSPEYVVTDFNNIVCELSQIKGLVSTLRAASVDSALTKMTTQFISYENLPEKYAKLKVLRDFDYIIQLNNYGKVSSIVELTPAKTAALSIKKIF